MHIEIKEKLRPFSHRPGIRVMIPFTEWEVQVFPVKLLFTNLCSGEIRSVDQNIEGPVRGFTTMLDLEKGRVVVFGRAQSGYFKRVISEEEFPFLKRFECAAAPFRLSLGVHKKQDWEMMERRGDMAEIFPHWVRLSQLLPERPLPNEPIGTMHLLDRPDLLFQAGFLGMFSPRLSDERFLGLSQEVSTDACPLGLTQRGAQKILSYFFVEEGDVLHLLPELPKEFHAGRLFTPNFKLEWSKKRVKKLILTPQEDRLLSIRCKKGIRGYRLRKSLRSRGEQRKLEEPLKLKQGQRLYLDRFTQ